MIAEIEGDAFGCDTPLTPEMLWQSNWATPDMVMPVHAAADRGAAKVALAHNHPSGDPSPSAADIEFTRQLVQAGRLMDVEVIDHVVIGHGPGRWVSLKGRGLGFE